MTIISRINDLLSCSESFCVVTIIHSDCSDIAPGNKTIVFKDGAFESDIHDPELNKLICKYAVTALAEQKKRTIEIAEGLHAFFDIMSEKPRLIICGAGHIAIPLSRFSDALGFSVTVIDDRSDFANTDRFGGYEIIARDFTEALREIEINESTFVVVVTRGHEHDSECLSEILTRQTAYVGLIGSRRRVRFVLEMLSRQGIPADKLEAVFTPIGLPIGAESPEEIALSICAELVCVRRKGNEQTIKLRNSVFGESK